MPNGIFILQYMYSHCNHSFFRVEIYLWSEIRSIWNIFS